MKEVKYEKPILIPLNDRDLASGATCQIGSLVGAA